MNLLSVLLVNTSTRSETQCPFFICSSINVTVYVLRYAASIDDILEEEEHYADQLKEYLFYTEAVR